MKPTIEAFSIGPKRGEAFEAFGQVDTAVAHHVAFKQQAASQVLLDAVVAKDKKDREAVKRMAAEEQREEMVTVLGAPAAKRQAKKRAAPAKKTPAEKAAAAEAKAAAAEEKATRCGKCKGMKKCMHGRICEHGRERRFYKEGGGSGLCEHQRQTKTCLGMLLATSFISSISPEPGLLGSCPVSVGPFDGTICGPSVTGCSCEALPTRIPARRSRRCAHLAIAVVTCAT